jgi:hypothetical protein
LGYKTERKRTMSSRGLYEPKESKIGRSERWLTIGEQRQHEASVVGKNGEEKRFLPTVGILFMGEGVSDISVGPLSGRPGGRRCRLDSNDGCVSCGSRTLFVCAPE